MEKKDPSVFGGPNPRAIRTWMPQRTILFWSQRTGGIAAGATAVDAVAADSFIFLFNNFMFFGLCQNDKFKRVKMGSEGEEQYLLNRAEFPLGGKNLRF